jgi:hypothetical protein
VIGHAVKCTQFIHEIILRSCKISRHWRIRRELFSGQRCLLELDSSLANTLPEVICSYIQSLSREIPCFTETESYCVLRNSPLDPFLSCSVLYKYCVSGLYPLSCFYLKHNVSDTGFCLRLQVKPIQLRPNEELR